MTRAGGWIAGGLLATGCFFQPTLDPAGDGSSGAGTDTGAMGTTQAAEDTSAAPTTGAATGSASGSTGETADATTDATTGVVSQCGDFEVDPGEECDNGAAGQHFRLFGQHVDNVAGSQQRLHDGCLAGPVCANEGRQLRRQHDRLRLGPKTAEIGQRETLNVHGAGSIR